MISNWSREDTLGDTVKNTDEDSTVLSTGRLISKLHLDTSSGVSVSILSNLGFVPSVHKRLLTTSNGVKNLGYVIRLLVAQEQTFKYAISGDKHLFITSCGGAYTDSSPDGVVKTGHISAKRKTEIEILFTDDFIQEIS